ncbi:PAS domain-containing protein, partial [Shigella boydii]|uniref:PAS domain-containing protein n=2 Tax=Shigella boydii TaxID=621 RepID=UPI000B3320C8
MSSHPYVTQQNTPLADDTTLMSTTDLQSYITHANDTFVQVSGFTLQELQGQPGNDSNLLIVFYVQIMPDDLVM